VLGVPAYRDRTEELLRVAELTQTVRCCIRASPAPAPARVAARGTAARVTGRGLPHPPRFDRPESKRVAERDGPTDECQEGEQRRQEQGEPATGGKGHARPREQQQPEKQEEHEKYPCQKWWGRNRKNTRNCARDMKPRESKLALSFTWSRALVIRSACCSLVEQSRISIIPSRCSSCTM
jgi:hypothetical protein